MSDLISREASLDAKDINVFSKGLISRQTAIEFLMDNMAWYCEEGYEASDDEKRDAITELINGVPDAQPTQTNTPNALETLDCVSRQEAIDELVRWGKIPDYNEGERNVIGCTIGMLSTLPAAQPELIRCGECTSYDGRRCSQSGWTCGTDDFCSFAEKKEDKE